MKQQISLICVVIALVLMASSVEFAQKRAFVRVAGGGLVVGGRAYLFVGANYWYGGLLGLESDKRRGIDRLRRELDILKQNGVTNLRLMAGSEGSGLINGVMRVGPSLQPRQGKFNARALDGLDIILDEMAKRDMRAVIFLSNNWEWSGGFQQYLIWNKRLDKSFLTKKPSWDELRDAVAKFYDCEPCKAAYKAQVRYVLARKNKITGQKYIDDPTIMAWEIANEPRPMRPWANDAYTAFLADASRYIKSLDPNHLVTLGHEGSIGTESVELFEKVHSDPNVDYLTIHIWPKNWGWIPESNLADGLQNAIDKSESYIAESLRVSIRLKKPLVLEEFGLPRDGRDFDPASETKLRDKYFETIFSYVGNGVAGANFWAFGGTARPVKGRPFWKLGDQYMGDPPMEEQGLNTVFDSDISTLAIIKKTADRIGQP